MHDAARGMTSPRFDDGDCAAMNGYPHRCACDGHPSFIEAAPALKSSGKAKSFFAERNPC
jgi:hypothetical protein